MHIRPAFVFVAVVATLTACAATDVRAPRLVTFEDDDAGAMPAAFEPSKSGPGAPGEWLVRDDDAAPSGRHVLVQTSTDPTDKRFPAAILRGDPVRDVRVRAKVKPISGDVDRACGLVARWTGEGDYYVTRANTLEGNVRLYHFVGGVRTQIGHWGGQIAAGVWHDYALEVVGDRLVVSWDGVVIIDMKDATIGAAGRVGVWTKADSVSAFDDFEVTRL